MDHLQLVQDEKQERKREKEKTEFPTINKL